MTVLVLARNVEPQVDRVVDELVERHVPIFRADLSTFPRSLTLTAQLRSGGWEGVLTNEHHSVRLEEIRSIWYRHPSHFVFDDRMSGPERRHAAAEARCGVGGVLGSLDVLWVNHPSRESDALKPRQLDVARRCGLTVPETLISNDPHSVRDFAKAINQPLAAKNLSTAVIAESGRLQAAFTRRLEPAALDYLGGVETTAHLFQAFIPKAFEARVTVVGEHIFGAAIHAGSDAARLDFRADYDSLTYSVLEPPEHVKAGIRAFMASFGLIFGAFDFAITPDDEWIMFECNPFGQYGWLENELGFPITQSLAELLAKGEA
ncbi:MAG: ATP-grasp ribosomal peptide maturase [Pseudonocardiaceae bacterium]